MLVRNLKPGDRYRWGDHEFLVLIAEQRKDETYIKYVFYNHDYDGAPRYVDWLAGLDESLDYLWELVS